MNGPVDLSTFGRARAPVFSDSAAGINKLICVMGFDVGGSEEIALDGFRVYEKYEQFCVISYPASPTKRFTYYTVRKASNSAP